jgi:hypothetical protein
VNKLKSLSASKWEDMERYKILAGILALKDQFTVPELAKFSGVNDNTTRTVIGRNMDLVEACGHKETGRKGGKLVKYRLKPSKVEELRADLKKRFEALNVPFAAQSKSKTAPSVPLGLLAAEDALLRLKSAADNEQKEHLLQLAEIGLQEGKSHLETGGMAPELQALVKTHINFLETLKDRDSSELNHTEWFKDHEKLRTIAAEFEKLGDLEHSTLALQKAADIISTISNDPKSKPYAQPFNDEILLIEGDGSSDLTEMVKNAFQEPSKVSIMKFFEDALEGFIRTSTASVHRGAVILVNSQNGMAKHTFRQVAKHAGAFKRLLILDTGSDEVLRNEAYQASADYIDRADSLNPASLRGAMGSFKKIS